VTYDDAFEALQSRDYRRAAALLEQAAQETRYASDLINHAYTLAIYHAGDRERLAEAAFQIGNSLAASDSASALDYFQRAITAGLDAGRACEIGEFLERRAASPDARPGEMPAGAVGRVAHVIGSLVPGQPATEYLKLLVASLALQGIQSTVFTTEWSASWFFNPAGVVQSQAVQLEADVTVASVEGDFEERATRIADTLHASAVPIAFFHASSVEMITARTASLRPAPLQVHVVHDGDIDADLFDARIYLSENALRRSRFSKPAEWIPPASDIVDRLQTSTPVTRHSLALESDAAITATFGDLQNVSVGNYLNVLSEILKRFPKNVHLFAGAGNVRAVRSFLHSEGVLPRVRFLGQMVDVAPLLDIVDVYLAPFPQADVLPILDAMGASRPVVCRGSAPDSPHNAAAELVGIPELIAESEGAYIQIADRLLRNPMQRSTRGDAMLDRFRREFRPGRLGERYKEFMSRFRLQL